MKRVLWLIVVAALAASNTGCFLNAYSSNPQRRIVELINQSEDLRQVELEFERFWFVDQPSHMTYEPPSTAASSKPLAVKRLAAKPQAAGQGTTSVRAAGTTSTVAGKKPAGSPSVCTRTGCSALMRTALTSR